MRKRAKKLFIPHEENDYKPDILQRVSVGVMFGLILLTFALANLQALLWMGSDWLVSSILPAVIVELTNEERIDESLIKLKHSDILTRAANLKAADMAENEYFAHYSPNGVSPWYWFDTVSYDFIHAGENLAVHFTESADVMEGWMNSPAHKENILNGNFTEIGIGTATGEYDGYPTVFVVQLFGSPGVTAVAPIPTVLAAAPAEEQSEITLETIIESEEDSNVAPVTFETITISEESEIPQIDQYEQEIEEFSVAITTDIGSSSEETMFVENPSPDDTLYEGTEVVEGPTEDADVAVVYSDLATTSRSGIAATFDINGGGGSGGGTSFIESVASNAFASSEWLQVFYTIMAVFVAVALTMSIAIEWRRQHPVQIAYGTGLLATMALLMYVHTTLTTGVLII